MANEVATIEKLLDAIAILTQDHVADRSSITPTCKSCGTNFPCMSVRVARNAMSYGIFHFDQLPVQFAEMPEIPEIPESFGWALRHIDEWISASGAYTGEMAQMLDELHHLVIADGVRCVGLASAAGFCELQFQAKAFIDRAIPLWGIVSDATSLFLRINVSHTTPTGRAFLGSVLSNAFSPVDADQLVAWWNTLDTCRTRTITTPFPDDTETAVTMLGQLISATYAVTDRLNELATGGL